jgi:flagellar biosynthesis chaperone FliJ
MRRFAFRLARVLRVRELVEAEARAAWAASELVAERAAAEAASAAEALRAARSGMVAPGALAPRRRLIDERVVATLATTAALRRESALTRRSQADRLALFWRARERDRRALDGLRERARARWRLGLRRREAIELDEGASVRAARERLPG